MDHPSIVLLFMGIICLVCDRAFRERFRHDQPITLLLFIVGVLAIISACRYSRPISIVDRINATLEAAKAMQADRTKASLAKRETK